MFGYYPIGAEPYGSAPLGGATDTFPTMAGARKRTSLVRESAFGVTPASPGFLLLRDIDVQSAVSRNDAKSPERRYNAAETGMVDGLTIFEKTIRLQWARDAATDILFASAFGGDFVADRLDNGRDQPTFTLEETYAATPSSVHRRLSGCVVDELAVVLSNGEPGQIRARLKGLAEAASYDVVAGATYTDPSPNYAPVTPANITVENLFSCSSSHIEQVSFAIRNNVEALYSWGSREPFGFSMGGVQLVGSVVIHFSNLAEYLRFRTRQRGLGMSLLLGSNVGARDRLSMMNVEVWSPDIDDPGSQGNHRLSLNFMARISSDTGALVSLTRNV